MKKNISIAALAAVTLATAQVQVASATDAHGAKATATPTCKGDHCKGHHDCHGDHHCHGSH